MILISRKLTRLDNFSHWKRSMMIALSARNKIKLVTEDFEEPDVTSPISSIEVYYHKLKGLWDELDALEAPYNCTCKCVCENGKTNGEREQRKRLIQFLMGLDESYKNLRGILLLQSLPIVAKAYNILKQEEKQRETLKQSTTSVPFALNTYRNNSTSDLSRNNRPQNTNQTQPRRSNFKVGVIYGNCYKEGHTKEECYKLVGFPVGHTLHNKYQPPNKRSSNFNQPTTNQSRTRAFNMTVTNEDTPVEIKLPPNYFITARMDQLQNQLNQVILMMQNNNVEASTSGSCKFIAASSTTTKITLPPSSSTILSNTSNSSLWHARLAQSVRIKSLLNAVRITVAQVYVNTALMKSFAKRHGSRFYTHAASKVPMFKPENGATLPKTTTVKGVMTEMLITTAEEKAQRRLEVKARSTLMMGIPKDHRRLDVKARSTLMMGIPNEHQLKFNSIKDAKKLLEAVKRRFGGNAATKKTQRNLLKQKYENFTAPSSEMLDQTFDRLKKLVSQLELLDEKLSQEDVNQKLLRSLSPEWNTHAVVWRNKADLDTMSMDDIYNNLKVYEPEVKGMSSSSSSTQNMAFVSSSNNNTSSTNEAVNTAHGVSTASTQVNSSNSTNIDNLSDVVICALFASQPNSPQLVHEDLQQIHLDDMEEMDLRWQMTILTMRARRFLKNTGRKLTVNSNETMSGQAEEGPNYALVAFSSSSSDSEVSNESICSKSCLKTIESQNDQLLKDLKKPELMVLEYKTGLKSVEEKLEVYKANEYIYSQDIKGLKFKIHIGEITIRDLRKKLETVQKEKDDIKLNVDKFEHASKSLNKLIECQIVDNCKKGLGYENYNAVPPPYTGNVMPPTPDLSFTGLDEFVNEPVVENCKVMSSEEEPKVVRKNDDALIFEEWVSDDEEEDVSQPKIKKK
ncbi:ribonuclease H-like domain-containing protein [Tanacetum coccineum]